MIYRCVEIYLCVYIYISLYVHIYMSLSQKCLFTLQSVVGQCGFPALLKANHSQPGSWALRFGALVPSSSRALLATLRCVCCTPHIMPQSTIHLSIHQSSTDIMTPHRMTPHIMTDDSGAYPRGSYNQSINLISCPWGQLGANRQSNHRVNTQTNLNSLWCSHSIINTRM